MAERLDRPKVLIANGAMWPGNDSSGPNLSVSSLCKSLASCFEFRVLARDRAFGASHPAVETGLWRDAEFGAVTYLPVRAGGAVGLRDLLRAGDYDVLWLNGFFDREFTLPALVMRRLGLAPRKPTIVSPRGEFGEGALGLKGARKRGYIALARSAGLLSDVCLHGTSEAELGVIREGFRWAGGYAVAPNLRPMIAPAPQVKRRSGAPLRLSFVGRISRVKNLDYALRVLAAVHTPASFRIYGPVQDDAYWAECEAQIRTLPPHISVTHEGEIANIAIPHAMAETDLLFLPTRGENFGHAIFEALSCGVPVLISDQTPWRDLERREAGWDLPLADETAFVRAIELCCAVAPDKRNALERGARRLAEQYAATTGGVAQTKAMIASMLAKLPAE